MIEEYKYTKNLNITSKKYNKIYLKMRKNARNIHAGLKKNIDKKGMGEMIKEFLKMRYKPACKNIWSDF